MRLTQRKQSRLSLKLVVYIVLISSLLALIATTLQFYFSYRREIRSVYASIHTIEESYLEPITSSLYQKKPDLTRVLLRATLGLNHIVYAAVREDSSGSESLVFGRSDVQHPIKREYELEFILPVEGIHHAGTLVVIASLDGVYARLLDQLVVVLLTNLAKTVVAIIAILAVIQAFLTQRLQKISEYLKSLNPYALDQPLLLQTREKWGKPDEITGLVDDINDLRERLKKGFSDRKAVEEKLLHHRTRLEELVEERTQELQFVNDALSESRSDLLILLEHSPDRILRIDRFYTIRYLNKPLQSGEVETYIGASLLDYVSPQDQAILKEVIDRTFSSGSTCEIESELTLNAEKCWYHHRLVPLEALGNTDEIMMISTDISTRKQAEKELKRVQEKLIERAHRAGMADVADGTLHNIGNILNTVNTCSHLIEEQLNQKGLRSLEKANELLRQNKDNLDEFILKDPKGRKLFQYYLEVEKVLKSEKTAMEENISRLKNSIAAITDIISTQQAYAVKGGNLDRVNLKNVVEAALVMQSESIRNNHIDVKKQLDEVPDMYLQKGKLLHIFINLLRNAKDALLNNPEDQRYILLKLQRKEEGVEFQIEDNGNGISEMDLERIFGHGFTTKPDGHGFGLYSCKTYMREMGGQIHAESSGRGSGSRFSLIFPSHLEKP